MEKQPRWAEMCARILQQCEALRGGREGLADFLGVPPEKMPQARTAVDRHMTRFRQASGLCRYPLAVQIFTARNPAQ